LTRRVQRRWPWFQQAVDTLAAILGIAIPTTMLIRDSWPIAGVVFSLVCLGKIGSDAAINALLQRWGGGK
jgi:hypothetical protein